VRRRQFGGIVAPMRAALFLLLVACPTTSDTGSSLDTVDSGGGTVDGDPDTIPLNGVCPLETRWGGFKVEANVDYSAVDGYISNGIVPGNVMEEALAEGDCRLMKRNNPYCNPICEAGETCDFDGTCLPYPENQDLGTVTIEGLRNAVSMEPSASGKKYFYTQLDTLAFDAGALIRLQTAGGAYAPLTLNGVGVAPLAPASLDWQIAEGENLEMAWDVPAAGSRGEVFLSLNVDQHGLTPLFLECVFEDDGAATVPSSVIDALLGAGITGYPSGKIQRRTADKVQLGAGCADFIVDYTWATDSVTVAGHTPCKGNDDCPDGQTCDLANETCR
jgi:hypothetical protein